MRWFWVLFVVGCTTPSPAYIWAGAPSKTVQVRNNTFKVYYVGNRAQAFRETPNSHQPVTLLQAQALVAIAQVTGCRVIRRSVRGDAVRTDARINCTKG
jgi:hypothetical protein